MSGDGFGKHFASTYTGSLFGAGPNVLSVWGYVIGNAFPVFEGTAIAAGRVELNPKLLAAVIGKVTEQEVVEAITYLCAPDPQSRTKVEEGRRLVREGEFLYRVVNFARHRRRVDKESRRVDDRLRQRNHRAREKSRAVKPERRPN